MTLDTQSPFASDIYTMTAQAGWILFEADTGTPVVNTTGLIEVE
jgi:hypothetical protein